MSNYDNCQVDIENPPTDLDGLDAPLIPKPERKEKEEDVCLDGIPSVQKPGYGNWIWAEKWCARRSGLTREEAMAIQAAYRVYEKDGDIREFYEYVVEYFRKSTTESMGMKSYIWSKRLLDFVQAYSSIMEVLPPVSSAASVAWAVADSLFTAMIRRGALQERVRTVDTLQKLLQLFVTDQDDQSVPHERESQGQETRDHASPVFKR